MPNTSRVVLLAALALGNSEPAHSQRPAPRPREDRYEQQAKPQAPQKAAREEQRGTASTPLFVKVMPTPPGQQELSRETRDREEKASSDRKLVAWTAVLAVTTFALMVFNGINLLLLRNQSSDLREQRGVMQRQAGHMEEQAVQLKASVAQMKDTAERQLRAYLVARPGNLLVDVKRRKGSYWLEWHPEIVNTGQTPAYDVRSIARAEIREEPLPPGTNLIEELGPITDKGSRGILGRDQQIWPSCDLGRYMAESELNDLKGKLSGKAWYVWGVVTYRDAFKETHRTEYCNLADWDSKGKPISRCAPQHNEAD